MPDSTKDTISQAYLELLDEGGSKTITVKDLVERAGVSRMTFYYHFTDIYDLVDWMFREYFETAVASIKSASDIWKIVAYRIFEMVENNDLGILDNYQHLDRAILDKNMTKLLHDIVQRCFEIDPACQKFSKPDREFLIQLMTYCLDGMISSMLDHDGELDPQDYISRFDRLIRQQIM